MAAAQTRPAGEYAQDRCGGIPAHQPFPLAETGILPEGLLLAEETPGIGNHPYHLAGLFYLQEPSAMAAIAAAEVRPGMRVLDLCAAPGGKSGGIAARLSGEGFLLANEIVPNRARTLASTLERLGVANAAVTCAKPEAIAEAFPDYFDVTLVDAPCSGEGMFRKDAGAVAEWSPAHVTACAARQSAILETAAKTVRGGGVLIYSTCTFSAEENENVVERFLAAHPGVFAGTHAAALPAFFPGRGAFRGAPAPDRGWILPTGGTSAEAMPRRRLPQRNRGPVYSTAGRLRLQPS